ncbi:MAG: hypothetical protein ACKVP4_00380 [Hyphomicrobium sp.]
MRKMAVLAFFALLGAAAAYGVFHDVGSRPTGVRTSGEIVDFTNSGSDFKSSAPGPTLAKVRLSDGSVVTVRMPRGRAMSHGERLELVEMVSPWGSRWYAPAD